ncbi:prophenin-2-like [Pogonomyrmex barbatus]|uniref:Prophenin-2-like n=1 Tax=Pogonomyrmex barbatus TaxID=144034 RepID=A0A6I9W838_9HYME|nr:prophenin-2-like [Pogonomyrmex barbatus]
MYYLQLVVLCVTIASVIGDLPPGTRRNTYLPPEKKGYTYSTPSVPFPTPSFPGPRPTPSFPGPRPTPSFPGPRPTPSFPGPRPTPSLPWTPDPTPTYPTGPTRPTMKKMDIE